MKEALSKEQVYEYMLEIAKTSNVIGRIDTLDGPWILNYLIYCLEKLDKDYNIHVDINITSGYYVPVRETGGDPTFVTSEVRHITVRISDFEAYLINEETPCEEWKYLLIVEEV